MRLQQVSDHCFAVLNDNNRLCDANSGYIGLGDGVVVDTQSDLGHARKMIELFSRVWKGMPGRVINTHEDADHVWGNQLFQGAEIIAHRAVPERMKTVANPHEIQRLIWGVSNPFTRLLLWWMHPGVLAAGKQLQGEYDFSGIELTPPTALFDEKLVLNLHGTEVHLIHVGPAHQMGDTIVHVPSERVVFSGDVVFRTCTPMGWAGSFENWLKCLDLLAELRPEVIVPGHGPVCGLEGVRELRAYLEYVRGEARRFFDAGQSSLEASKKIDLGPYAGWSGAARIYFSVERAYREFRGEPLDAPWDIKTAFDAMHAVMLARGAKVEF
jgi:glyoxylase-like metal-dependent hydrolase (beta-lactamase superfamily II)